MIKILVTAFIIYQNIFREIVKLFQQCLLALIFAADDKTEEATPKKKSDSRKKGQIARSKDVSVSNYNGSLYNAYF